MTLKTSITLLFIFLFGTLAFGQNGLGYSQYSMHAMNSGISIGAAIAVVASWSRNKSVLWALLHGFLGWIYIIYYVVTR